MRWLQLPGKVAEGEPSERKELLATKSDAMKSTPNLSRNLPRLRDELEGAHHGNEGSGGAGHSRALEAFSSRMYVQLVLPTP